MTEEKIFAKYGLPLDVKFCKRCVMSNQRPSSAPEFHHNINSKKIVLNIDEQGVCDACRYAEKKDTEIDWKKREQDLIKLLDQYRRNDGYYDCVVPGSGGKDSVYASHLLKYKYGMNPLTVTWPPHLYTEVGIKNFRSWIDKGGFDNIMFSPNGRIHRLLTKLAFTNLLHPFQPFILGQKTIGPKIALKYDIPLVFYGESEAEYGNPIAETLTSLRSKSYYCRDNIMDYYLGGVSIKELFEKYDLTLNDIDAYLPPDEQELENKNIQVHYLGYYIKWTPQECYYYASENVGFEANSERTEGTFSKYNSIDDRIDGLHYYTTYIKFGLGRASYEASQEVRNHHLTREEALSLVHRFDHEFPKKFHRDVLEYIDISDEEFWKLIDEFRSPHLWKKEKNEWILKYKV